MSLFVAQDKVLGTKGEALVDMSQVPRARLLRTNRFTPGTKGEAPRAKEFG